VASAFISYAHDDQEFVLALAERLRAQGLEIRYDQVVLQIGDSLIRRLSDEISDGDFLIAIVSPDSVDSEWCQKELALAATQGINERRVKVLPVRFRKATMPPMLQDTFWGDADQDDIETLARRLAAAIRANLEGREAEAAGEAEAAEDAGGEPAHAEVADDIEVSRIDELAERLWDVFAVWPGVWRGQGNIRDLDDPQRRLRWALDKLPDRVRGALPLVEKVATADWDAFFGANEPADVERDVREELRSVRTQVAQGLPVTGRWTIAADLGPMSAGRRDADSYLWEIRRGEETRRIQVFISGTAMRLENDVLPPEVAQAKETNGRSVVATLLALDDPPEEVMATTAGISLALPP
jgi:TIR domain